MLDHIRVKGFQSLRDVDIDLGSFTVILGESGTGKSAFIRSVLKMVRNDAVSGTSGGESWSHLPPSVSNAVITLSVDDHEVQWRKGKDNVYRIDGSALTKVGRGCPDEVQDVLKMRELTFDGNDKYHLNFAQQFDMPFLLDDSGSKVAKILGEITNVNILYAANRQANASKTQAARTLTVRTEDLEQQKELLQEFSGLPKKRAALKQMQTLQDGLLEKVALYKELFAASTRLGRLQEQVDTSQVRLIALQELPEAAERVVTLFEALSTYKALSTAGMTLGACRVSAKRLGDEAKNLNPVRKVDADALAADVSRYYEMMRELKSLLYREDSIVEQKESLERSQLLKDVDLVALKANLDRYNSLLREQTLIRAQADVARRSTAHYIAAEKALAEADKRYAEFVAENPLCPFCGSALDADHEEAHV